MNVNLMSQNGENGRNPSKVLVFGDALLRPSTPKISKLKNFQKNGFGSCESTNLILRLDLKTKTYGSANPEITYSEVRPKNPKKWPFLAKKRAKMNFAEHGINTKSVDIGLNYLNMQFGPNR